jgi:signal transduction histidine kinase
VKLLDLVVAVRGRDRERIEKVTSALRAEGATVRAWTEADASFVLPESPVDAVMLEVGLDAAGVVADSPRPSSLQSAVVTATREARMLHDRLRGALSELEAVEHAARTLSHDARVLCGIVVGYGANVRDAIAGPVTDQQKEHARRIIEAANEVAGLLQAFTESIHDRVEAAKQGEAPPPSARATGRRTLCDVSEIVRATVRLFEGVADRKRVRIDLNAEQPASAWCDGTEIKQVVTNLVVNAIKFAPEGERVLVSVRPGGAEALGYVEIVVSDTGPGIPLAERDRVFLPGARLERDAGVPGSGLGLSVVKDIVSRHGGAVCLTDTPGGGATFIIKLPADMRARRGRMPSSVREDASRPAEEHE